MQNKAAEPAPLRQFHHALDKISLASLSDEDLHRMDQYARDLITAITVEWFRRDKKQASPSRRSQTTLPSKQKRN